MSTVRSFIFQNNDLENLSTTYTAILEHSFRPLTLSLIFVIWFVNINNRTNEIIQCVWIFFEDRRT